MSIRVATTRLQDLQTLATGGQSSIDAWRSLHTLLARELSADHAALLTEPVANSARGEIDWYAEAGPTPSRHADLPPAEQAALRERLGTLVADIESLSARLTAGRGETDRFLGAMLGLALRLPGEDSIYAQGDQPRLVGWGHVPATGQATGQVTGIASGLALTGRRPAAFSGAAQSAPGARAALHVLPPPASPYAVQDRRRLWLWPVLAGSLLAPLLVACLAWQDPFGWFAIEPAQCRVAPGQLDTTDAMRNAVSREGVLRAELARLSADAGQRRLQCPPIQAAAAPAPAPVPPPRSADAERAERRGAQTGKLQVILAWDDRNDLDLHVGCPDGQDINFIRRQACGGTLDVDANGDVRSLSDSPVENVFFTEPAPGRYRVIVDPYGMRVTPNSPFRITIRRDGQPDQVVTGTSQNGRRNQTVTDFTVDAR